MRKNSNDNPEMFRSCPKLPDGWHWRLVSSGNKLILSIRRSGLIGILGDPDQERLMSMTTMEDMVRTSKVLYQRFLDR